MKTKDEIIAEYRRVLKQYADPDNWSGPFRAFVLKEDFDKTEQKNGTFARNVLDLAYEGKK